MAGPLKILLVSPEVHPFAKVGGLGDVSGALPRVLKELGHDVRVILPKYRNVEKAGGALRPANLRIAVPVGPEILSGALFEGRLGRSVPVYCIEQQALFDREGVYDGPEGAYSDNPERFIFYCRAALEACRAVGFQPDIIHCNDWASGLVPCYLKTVYTGDPFFKRTRTMFSIHNLGYQGNFGEHVLAAAHLPRSVFTLEGAEFYGSFNFMKAALVYADMLTTVSATYCREIQTPEHGFGMDGVLRHHRKKLFGILNGADYQEWDPRTDTHIKARYGPRSLQGKRDCRKSLMRKLSLKIPDSVPIIGLVTRLTHQKGIDLLVRYFDELMALEAAWAILGTGDPRYETFLAEQSRKYPGRFHYERGFSEPLAHQLIAGSDLLLMPSLYEPCGLTQMYALRYGTVPVVHRAGGLVDTVKAFSPRSGRGTGFLFQPAEPLPMIDCLQKALAVYQNKKAWRQLMLNGMKENFSWDRSAERYIRLYRKALASQ